MKKKIFIINLLFLMSILNIVVAEDMTLLDYRNEVNDDWFSVNVKSFNGKELNSPINEYLNIEVSHRGMHRFDNKGQIDATEDLKQATYEGVMIFPFIVHTYTNYDEKSISAVQSIVSEPILELRTFTDYLTRRGFETEKFTIPITTLAPPSGGVYDGNLILHTEFSPKLSVKVGDSMQINGVVFNVVGVETFMDRIKAKESKIGVANDPDQNFYDDDTSKIISVKEQNVGIYYGGGGVIHDTLNNMKLEANTMCGDGLERIHTIYKGNTTIPLNVIDNTLEITNLIQETDDLLTSESAQEYVTVPTKDTTWLPSDDLNEDENMYDFSVPMKISSNMFANKYKFNIRYSRLTVDVLNEADLGFGDPDLSSIYSNYAGICEYETMQKTFESISSVGVQNMFSKTLFEAEMKLRITIEPDVEGQIINVTALEGYNLEVLETDLINYMNYEEEMITGDVVWDEVLDEPIEYNVNNLFIIIALVIVIVVGYLFFTRKKKSKTSESTRTIQL